MKLQQLRYVLAIADSNLNMSAAANRLYTSQPGISKQIKLLEEELAVQIFVRKGKSLSAVTVAGTEIIAQARVIMREVKTLSTLKQKGQCFGSMECGGGAASNIERCVLPRRQRSWPPRI